jgi:hypothetical protein
MPRCGQSLLAIVDDRQGAFASRCRCRTAQGQPTMRPIPPQRRRQQGASRRVLGQFLNSS